MKPTILIQLILFFVLATLPLLIKGQDARFAQFYAAPLQTNPALTGVFEGRWRVTANYRDQWGSVLNNVPFRTVAASFEMKYRSFQQDHFAFGLTALRDEGGSGNFIQNRAYLTASYLRKVAGSNHKSFGHFVVAGAQVGGGQNEIALNDFWFSNQFDLSIGGFPNLQLDNLETNISSNEASSGIFLDFNAGLLYYAVLDYSLSYYLGAALFHINQPDVSFFDNDASAMGRKYAVHGGAELGLTNEISLLPAAQFLLQNESSSLTVGSHIRYNSREWNEVALRMGVWPHLSATTDSRFYTESVTINAILEYHRIHIGLSYDITISDLQQANNSRGAFEVSLLYTQPARERVKTVCPKF